MNKPSELIDEILKRVDSHRKLIVFEWYKHNIFNKRVLY